jgi:hypothetical protein
VADRGKDASMRGASAGMANPARPFRLIVGGGYGQEVENDRDRLEELYELLTRLADDADPVRAAVLRAWSRVVETWIRLGPR